MELAQLLYMKYMMHICILYSGNEYMLPGRTDLFTFYKNHFVTFDYIVENK